MQRQDLRLANDTPAHLGVQQGRAAGLQPAAVLERVTQTVLMKMLEVTTSTVYPRYVCRQFALDHMQLCGQSKCCSALSMLLSKLWRQCTQRSLARRWNAGLLQARTQKTACGWLRA